MKQLAWGFTLGGDETLTEAHTPMKEACKYSYSIREKRCVWGTMFSDILGKLQRKEKGFVLRNGETFWNSWLFQVRL